MKGSEFVFHYFYLFYYKFHKINQNSGGPYIDSLHWINRQQIPSIKKMKSVFNML